MPEKKKPYKFQEDGIDLIHKWKKCIVGDPPGLGKTITSTVAIDRVDAYPLLVICPATLKPNWKIEFEDWTGKNAMILNDSIKNTFPILYRSGLAQAFIINYESLAKYFVYSMPKDRKHMKLKDIVFNSNINLFKSVIFDEGHRAKEPDAIQTKLVRGITKNKEYVLDLTGTPVLNTPHDLAAQFAIIDQIHHFGGYKNFLKLCDNPSQFNLDFINQQMTQHCYFRREKKDVIELPAKTRQKIIVEIDNKEEYRDAIKDLANYLKEWKGKTDAEVMRSMRGEVMVKISVLKQISARGKIAAVMENVKDTMASGEKIVLFGHHREVLDCFREVEGAVFITGKEKTNERQASIESFQNDPNTKICVCSIQAAGVGVTLTKGRINMYIEMGWHPAIMEQAEDRQHRIGQDREVHCIYFLGNGTIDEWIYSLIEKKRDMSNAVLGRVEDIEWGVVEQVIELILNDH